MTGRKGSVAGALKILLFLIVLMIFFWGLDAYKRYRSGWTKWQKGMYIIGGLLLTGAAAAVLFSLIRVS